MGQPSPFAANSYQRSAIAQSLPEFWQVPIPETRVSLNRCSASHPARRFMNSNVLLQKHADVARAHSGMK